RRTQLRTDHPEPLVDGRARSSAFAGWLAPRLVGQRAPHGVVPPAQLDAAGGWGHAGQEFAFLGATSGKAGGIRPDTGLAAGEPGGAEGGGLVDARTIDGPIENVGEELHGPAGSDHAAIDA